MAKELLFTGRVVEAEEACRIGLLNHPVPSDKLMPTAIEIAQDIAANDPRMVQGLWVAGCAGITRVGRPLWVADFAGMTRRGRRFLWVADFAGLPRLGTAPLDSCFRRNDDAWGRPL